MLLLSTLHAVAQDDASTSVHTEVHTTTEGVSGMEWMNNPYIWVAVGAVLLIVLIAALTRKGPSTTEVKRTVITRTEVTNE